MGIPDRQAVTLEFEGRYSLLDGIGKETAGGQTQLVLDDKSLGLKPTGKPANYIPLREINEVIPGDYNVTMMLSTSEMLIISQLGRNYENFQRELAQRRRDLTLSDLLMEESLIMEGLHSTYRYLDAKGIETQNGNCELRLYQTALIIVPELNLPLRLPYSDITTVIRDDYRLTSHTEGGETFIFDRMGRDLEPFNHVLVEQIHTLDLAVQALVKQMAPSADLAAIPKLAVLMKEGRAARRADIENVGANLWGELEQHIIASEAGEEYEYLRSLGQTQDICIGIKRGLRAVDSEYLWFMVPVFSTDTTKPGNTVIMEAVSDDGTGRATYAFRMVSRNDYSSFKTLPDLQDQMSRFIKTINRALLTINFRREPIYLTEEMLLRPQYEQYRYSVRRIPELQILRQLYIGRVIHKTPEQWQSDIKDLLAFNVSTRDDSLPWVKKAAETITPPTEGN